MRPNYLCETGGDHPRQEHFAQVSRTQQHPLTRQFQPRRPLFGRASTIPLFPTAGLCPFSYPASATPPRCRGCTEFVTGGDQAASPSLAFVFA
jgi:hypothetical protein